MARPFEQSVGEITLLVDDPRKISFVVRPRRRGLSGEALHTSECHVLYIHVGQAQCGADSTTADRYLNDNCKEKMNLAG
jgi:hypothetical protein